MLIEQLLCAWVRHWENSGEQDGHNACSTKIIFQWDRQVSTSITIINDGVMKVMHTLKGNKGWQEKKA